MAEAFPPIGVTAVIAGMALFNRDAAQVENRLLQINRVTRQMEATSAASAGGAGEAFSTMASSVATAGVVIAGAVALAGAASVKFAADFQQGLKVTEAITGATDDQMRRLTNTITSLARTGTVSLDDLSEGARELARAGIGIEPVIDGALGAVQQLTIAAGGELSLKSAALLVAGAMNAFGIEAKDAERITTAASVAAQNSTATFTGFGQGVAIAGASFRQAGFTLEDFGIALTLTTKGGATASVAATALRGVIQRLIRPSKDAAKVMEQYGIHLFDAAGKGVGFEAVVAQLNAAFSDQAVAEGRITEEERLHALATIGLQRTNTALFALVNTGTEQFAQLRSEFERLKATKLAETVMEALNSQLQIAANNVQVLALAFGTQFLPALTDATKQLVAFLQGLDTEPFKALARNIIQAGAAVVEGVQTIVATIVNMVVGLGLGNAAVEFFKTALVTLGAVVLGVIVPPILTAVAALTGFIITVGLIGKAIEIASGILARGADAVADWALQFGPLGKGVSDFARGVSDSFRAIGDVLRGDFDAAAMHSKIAFQEFAITLRDDGGNALDAIGKKLDEVGAQWAPWAAEAGPAGVIVSNALSGVHGVVETLAFLLQGNFDAAAKSAKGALDNFGKAVEPITTAINGALKTALTWLSDTAWPAIQKAASAFTSFVQQEVVPRIQSIAGAISGAVSTWLNWLAQTGWPAVQRGAEESARIIRSQVIPSLGELVSKIENDVMPAVKRFATQGLPQIGSAAGDVFNALGTMGDGIRRAIQNVNDTLKPFDDLKQAWFNVQAIGVALGAAASNLGAVLGTILGPVNAATGGFTGLERITNLLGTVLTLPIALLKVLASVIVVATQVVLDAAQQFAAFTAELRTNTTTVQTTAAAIGTALAAALVGVITWGGQVIATISGFAGQMAAAGASLGQSIVSGLVSGISNGIGSVTAAARNLASSALAAARAALGAQSPSREFEDLGDDVIEGFTNSLDAGQYDVVSAAEDVAQAAIDGFGDVDLSGIGEEAAAELSAGLIAGLDAMKLPVRQRAASVVDEALRAFADISTQANQAIADVQAKIINVGEELGRKINEAIQDAMDQIERVTQDTENRIQDMIDGLNQSRSDRARRESLSGDQNARRQARRDAQEDADAEKKRLRSLSDAEFQLKQDLEKAKTKEERQRAQERYDEKVADIARNFALEQADRVAERQRRQEDADFERKLDEETRQLNDALENEALLRSIARANEDRDARIKAINEALAEKQNKLREQAQREIDDLNENVKRKLKILEDEFAKKAADVLRKGGEDMRPLVDNIQNILSGNFEAMKRASDDFTHSVEDAIGALKRLEAARRSAQFSAPSLPSPTTGLGGGQQITSSQDTGSPSFQVPSFAHGGLVPGALGKPMLAVVHGGEFIASFQSEAARLARTMRGAPAGTMENHYSYSVNPRYENYQSPASMEMDLRALIMLSRGA